jgi:hypothetical protein
MKNSKGLVHIVVALSLAWCVPAHGDAVTDWNAIALSCTQGPPAPPNRPGPPGLMDIALVQIAVHDAVQAVQGRFEAYEYEDPSRLGVGSAAAAASAAAHGVLVGLYGPDDPCLATVTDPAVTYAGDPALQTGAAAAAAVLPLYRPTMTLPTDPFVGGTAPGEWRPTPGVTQGANTFMAVTAPFAMLRPSHFRPPAPPPLTSTRYFRDYEEVRLVGALDSTTRTPEQTDLARFWSINFIVQWYATLRGIATAQLTDLGDTARLFALVAISSADSQISAYDAKYHYNYWRPITAIREGGQDGNAKTTGDAAWTPFLTTPPYPEFHSGANLLAASITGILRRYFGSDELSFSVSTSAANVLVNPRHYTRLSQVEQEMVDVRIYQGIHFRTADELGRLHGGRIAHWTYINFLRPLPGTR